MLDSFAPDLIPHIQAGNQAAGLAQFDEAVLAFSRAIEADPTCREAYLLRSYANAACGDYPFAIADLNKAIDMEPDAELYQIRAGYQLRLLNFPEVILDTSAAMQLGGDLADGFFRRGSAYLSAGDIERALNDLREYVRLMGEAATPWAVETIAEMEEGGDLFQLTDAAFYNSLGRGYLERLLVDEAITEFSLWIKLKPSADAYTARGEAYALLGHYEDALADLNKAVDLDVDHAGAYRQIGLVSASLEQYDIAIESFDYAIALFPEDPVLYFYRGQAHRESNEMVHALADLSRAIDLGLDQPRVFYEHGLANMAQGLMDTAVMDFNRALTLQPDFAAAYLARGQASARMGYSQHAVADFKRAVELAPYEAEAHLQLGNAYHHAKETDLAIEHLRQYVQLAGTASSPRILALLKRLDS